MKRFWSASSVRAAARKKAEQASAANKAPSFPVNERAPTKTQAVPQSDLEWMWGRFEKSTGNEVILAVPEDDTDSGLEMGQLCATLGLKVTDVFFYKTREKPRASTYVPAGFIEELQKAAAIQESTAVVIDAPLSPGQVKNLEQELGCAVADRQGVILAIFDLHAKSKLAQMQVELARLKYLQPRLAGIWSGLSRQRGGKGGLRGRGQGETRLELDRRVVRERISTLTRKLREAEKAYAVQSKRRSRCPRVALVGYTNAGKSTLMRRLTRADVEVEDRLFCTLDTTVRPILPPTEPPILVSDTVGFVKDLPHDLVASFRSTLHEATDSALILHVVDGSHPRWMDQADVTDGVLEEIGAGEIPKLLVLNKIDSLEIPVRMKLAEVGRWRRSAKGNYIDVVGLSALTGEGTDELVGKLKNHFGTHAPQWATQEDSES